MGLMTHTSYAICIHAVIYHGTYKFLYYSDSYKFGIYCRANGNMMKCACLSCKINVHLLLQFWAGKWDSETGCVVVVCHCDGTKVSVPLTGPGVCHGEDPGYNRVFSIDFRDHNINMVGIFRSLLTHELLTVPPKKNGNPLVT